jgi:mannose-6-phosphate isomerase class I
MSANKLIKETFEKGNGILRLIPVFVPRRFSKAGLRLRLHPHDYYALGTKRGSIKERWFSSVIPAMNGELAPADEGMSYVLPFSDKLEEKFTLKSAVDELKESIIGRELFAKYGTWPMYSKFFDYQAPLFHHLHLGFEDAKRVGRLGKPEAYYYPPQMNNYPGEFPHTYFGFDPDVTKDMIRDRLMNYENGDIRITELSRAYRIELGTGWYTPPGVVHAPGSYLTYEPQWNSDVNSVYENKRDIDYVISLMDWEKNIDPNYKKHYFRAPVVIHSDEKYTEKWITYANDYIAAKEMAIQPGQTVTIKDKAAYGCIIIQGHGKFGVYDAETAVMLRFGQASSDEYFVSENAAKEGVKITNNSKFEPMVILKHFGPNNPDMPKSV